MEDGPQLTVQMEAPQAGAASQQPGQPLVSAVPAQAELLQQGVGLPVRTPGSGHRYHHHKHCYHYEHCQHQSHLSTASASLSPAPVLP